MSVELSPAPRILVITLRRLGDVLLTTPLTRTLKHGWPGARVDMLVVRGTEGILAGNPDIAHVITISEKPSALELMTLLARLFRRYDLAVTTQAGDRPTLLAWAAGRRRIGIVGGRTLADRVKARMLHRSVPADPGVHRVTELLRLIEGLGIPARPELVCPAEKAAPAITPPGRYAVLHANPKFSFRRWPHESWRALAAELHARGIAVVVSGAGDVEERQYLDEVWGPATSPVMRADGKLDWGQLTALIRAAAVYVGPDTSVTHLAAGTGCPTVALYGPASPVIIGPWPTGGLEQPWAAAGTIQRRSNVRVVQNPLPCMPCEALGCERHYGSHSRCLEELPVRQVLDAIDDVISASPSRP